MKHFKAWIFLSLAALVVCALAASAAESQRDKVAWTSNLDFKDLDQYGPFVGREVIDGQWKAGVSWTPWSIYRVDEQGWARRWFHIGGIFLTNAENWNPSIGPAFGVDIVHWTNQDSLTGVVEKGASFWKPLGLSSVALTFDTFAGWTPIHDKDVHSYALGFGARLVLRGGGSYNAKAHDIIRKGL